MIMFVNNLLYSSWSMYDVIIEIGFIYKGNRRYVWFFLELIFYEFSCLKREGWCKSFKYYD